MADAVRILHVQDAGPDVARVHEAASAGGLSCSWTMVSSRQAFDAALSSPSSGIDVILAHESAGDLLPGEALQLAAARRPDLPFICLFDCLDEGRLVERLKAGAADCVRLRRLDRLPPAIQRGLGEREQRAGRGGTDAERSFLEQMMAASPSIAFRFHPQTHVLSYVSPNVGWLLGYAADEAVGSADFWERILHPDDRARLFARLAVAINDLVAQIEQECRYRARDDRERWFYTLLRIEYDADARPVAVVGYALDIADRKAAEEQVRTERAFSDSIIENLPAIVFVKDARTLRYVRFNNAAEETLGIGSDEVLGRTEAELFPQALAEASAEKDRVVLETRKPVDIAEEIVISRGREPRVLHTKKIPVLDDAGEPLYVVGVSIDITEQRVAHEQVRLAKLEAERASRAKSDFLSRMSHDLRTPLNAILGFAQILQMDRLTAEQAEAVQQILRGGVHLLELINEVLDIARIEAGQLSLSPEPVAVGEVITHVVEMVRPLGKPRRITLRADVNGAVGLHARADRQRLKQVLVNLVSNAVKSNRQDGQVRVAGVLDRGTVRILVTDTGPGIRADKRALLFQPFERLGAEQSGVEGTGLGLAVSKGLTEAMGGRIGYESTADVGTTFWVELPHAPAPAPRPSQVRTTDAGQPEAAAGTVLYVEDNRSNVRLLERLLARRPGVVLLTAATGEAALRMIRERQPDLVLLDLHLPDMSGEEVLRRVWAAPTRRAIPVAVLSADATPRQQQRLLAAGAVAYLTKPLDVAALLQIVDERLAGKVSR
jgi:PAS domain S-box-containing protein